MKDAHSSPDQPPAEALPVGLTSAQAQAALRKYGPNEIAPTKQHPLLDLLRKFWSPIPWLLAC